MDSHEVPNMFPWFSMCSPRVFWSCAWCEEWTDHCSLSTWTVDFPCKFCILFFVIVFLEGGIKAKSSQVPDMFSKEFPIAPHFYPISFGKCCPHSRAKGWGTLHFKIEPFILGNLHSLFLLSDGPIKLAHCKKRNLNLRHTSSNEWERWIGDVIEY
jgi:hypothetical protein